MKLRPLPLIVLPAIAAGLICLGCTRDPRVKAAKFMESGKKYAASRDYARAVLEFQNASRLTPRDPDVYYQLALSYVATGDVRSAVINLRKTIELNPKHTGAHIKMTELMAKSRNKEVLAEAEKHAQEALKSSPDNPEALDALGLVEMRLGKLDDALRYVEKAHEKAPEELKPALALAGMKLNHGDRDGAEKVLKDTIAQKPKAVEPVLALASLYMLMGKTAQAEEELRHALKLDPKSELALRGLAATQLRTGQRQPAEQTLKELSALPNPRFRPIHAEFLLQEGKSDEAITELEALAKKSPEDRAARTRLVQAYLSTGRTADAEKILLAALQQNPMDVDALLQMSDLNVRSGKLAEAQNNLVQVLRFRPDAAEAHYLMAKIYRMRGNAAGRKQELGEALRLNPSMLDARVELARELIVTSGAKSALELLNEAPPAQKNTLAVIVERNWAQRTLRNEAEFRKGIDQGLALARTPDLLFQDALFKLDHQDYRGAESVLKEGLKQSPDDFRLLDALGRTYVAQRQVAKALETFRQYASERPKSAVAQQFLGKWLIEAGYRNEARSAFAAAKVADPNFVPADMALARLDFDEGKIDATRQRLSALLQKRPDDLGVRLFLGDVEETAGNHAQALEHYRKVVDGDDSNVAALNNLAYLLADFANQPDEALKYAQRAKELAPNDPGVADTLGWVFYRKGIYQTAVTQLESSTDPSARHKYHLAIAYMKAGDAKRGQQMLQQALKLDANLPEAKMAREMLPRQ